VIWSTGPAGPWPPIDLIEVAIDALKEGIFAPTPVGADASIVAGLVVQNTPPATSLGTLRKKDIPTHWCVWK